MNYRVIWRADAEQELADLWLNAVDRNVVSQAAAAIDQLLARDAELKGESRPDGRRILFASPLAVTYRVHSGKRQVDVLHIWRFRTSSG